MKPLTEKKKEEIEDKLLKEAMKQPNTINGLIRGMNLCQLALLVVLIKYSGDLLK